MIAKARVDSSQRFTAASPCPVCGGHEGLRRGQGERCTGFLSEDGTAAFCSRTESSKAVDSAAGPLYVHRLAERVAPPRPAKTKGKGKGHRTPQEAAESLSRWLKSKGNDPGEIAGTWYYRDRAGQSVLAVVRFERPDPETEERIKTYRPFHLGPDDLWRTGDPDGPLPLYQLPTLAEADLVIITEGEKAADAVRSLGLTATTPAHGAQSPGRSDWSPLAGKQVVILPDNDDPGREFAAKVVDLLAGLNPPPTINVVELPGLPPKGDAVEWVEAGGTADELLALVESGEAIKSRTGEPGAPPEILVTTREFEVVGQAIAALAAEPELYQRGNVLVTVLRDSVKAKGLRRPPNTPRIGAIQNPRLRDMVTRHATLLKARKARSGDPEIVPTHPPDWLVPAIQARGEWPSIRPLEGIVEAPTIRPDGSMLDLAGWDEATGLLYEPNAKFKPIPNRPSIDDAGAAAQRLLGLVADFPFIDDDNRAAWLAGLLTSVARYAIGGPCPLFLFDANTPGTGKSLLCHLIAIIARGRAMACADYPESEEEMAKTLLSIALAGDPFVLFDNVSTGFSVGGKSLDRALTAPTIKGRILGRSEISAELPWNAIVFASGNNLGIKGDALRRVIPIRLETLEEQPEERTDFSIKNIVEHVTSHRGEMVADALTILRAHAIAGYPDQGLSPIGSYEDWCRVVRNAVHWSTGHDPAGPRKQARANDPETQAHAALVEGWAALCRESPDGLTAKEALDAINANPQAHEDLRSLLCEWSRDGNLPSARVMGNRLNKIRGRVTAKGALDFSVYLGSRRWFVKPPRRGASGGSSDSGDSAPTPRAENSHDICSTKITAYGGGESHQKHQSHQDGYFATDPDDANLGRVS